MFYRYLIYILKLFHLKLWPGQNEAVKDLKHILNLTGYKNKDFRLIKSYRDKLLSNNDIVDYTEYGAGSKKKFKNMRSIREIAGNSGMKIRNIKKIYNLTKYFSPEIIIELGTSLGIGTLNLALAAKNCEIITIEGNSAVQELAGKNLEDYKIKNIRFCNDLFDNVLEEILKENMSKKTMVYIDGNHKYGPTLKYFKLIKKYFPEKILIIIDDINWSKGMYMAWKKICNESENLTLISCFDFGIVLKEE